MRLLSYICVNKRSGAKVAQSATKRRGRKNGSSNKQKSTVQWKRWNRRVREREREKKMTERMKNVIKFIFLFVLCAS